MMNYVFGTTQIMHIMFSKIRYGAIRCYDELCFGHDADDAYDVVKNNIRSHKMCYDEL